MLLTTMVLTQVVQAVWLFALSHRLTVAQRDINRRLDLLLPRVEVRPLSGHSGSEQR